MAFESSPWEKGHFYQGVIRLHNQDRRGITAPL